jgi:hypothetical protein
VALSQARILYQNHSGDYPQVILTIPVTCRTATMQNFFYACMQRKKLNIFLPSSKHTVHFLILESKFTEIASYKGIQKPLLVTF